MAQINQVSPNRPVASTLGGADTAAAAGMGTAEIHGEKVRVHLKNMQSILEDAAEELTFVNSEKVEKDMAKRKINSRSAKSIEAVAAAERIRAYLDKVPDLEKTKRLSAFIEDLRHNAHSYSQDDYRQAAREFSDDETHQYIALLSAHQQLQEEGGDEEQLRVLGRAIQELHQEHGPAIRAGLNVSAVAAEHARDRDLGDTQSLRTLYRDSVLDYHGLSDAYSKMVEAHPARCFQKTVKFILAALSADLAATDHSLDKTRLQAIVKDIQQLRLLGSMHENCDALLTKMAKLYNEKTADAGKFMHELIDIVDTSWYNSNNIRQLPVNLQVHKLDAQLYFMREFKQMVKDIPMKFYASDYGRRDKFVANVQEAMDIIIDEESRQV